MHVLSRVSRFALAAVVLVSAASLAACGDDDNAAAPGDSGGASGAGGTASPHAGHAGTGAAGSTAGHAGSSAGSAGASGSSAGSGGNGGSTAGMGGSSGANGGADAAGAAGDAGTGGTDAAGAAGNGEAGSAGASAGDAGQAGQAGDAGQAGQGGASGQAGQAGEAGQAGQAGEAGQAGAGGSPASSVPTAPISFKVGEPFTVNSGTTNWVYVPKSYDKTHQTPAVLFIWLHGCGGQSEGDIYTVSPGGTKQTWISLTVGGQEGKCWDVKKDPARVLAALADIKTHFNIAPRSVVLGGYSSGGDLTYRTGFYNADLFAGLLVENTSPFRDTGSSEAASLAAASWKINIVHLAHTQDTTYPIAGVKKETDAVLAAGFPLTLVQVDGTHYDNPNAVVNGHAVPGTSADILTYLTPHLSDGWLSP
jgi:hypothetical protein